MHLIDAKCNNRIITSLFHFVSTLATQNEIKKNQNVIIITLLQNVLQQCLNISLQPQRIIKALKQLFLSHSDRRANVELYKSWVCLFYRVK